MANYEVEQKFRVDSFEPVLSRLETLGGPLNWHTVEQRDSYFGHPSRDFAATDEALRVRQIDGHNRITYKGPKIDSTTKTRQEIEFALPEGGSGFDQVKELLVCLGFRLVGEVVKTRRATTMVHAGWAFEIALDALPGLGQFVELETAADQHGLPTAREQLQALADTLGLRDVVRTSYLEMVLR